MKQLLFIPTAVVSVLFFCLSSPAQQSEYEMLKNMPQPFSTAYHCGDAVQVVNHLRRLGKEEALKVLEHDLTDNASDDKKVILICRLLFLNPSGWPPPRLGVPVPDIETNGGTKFPLFPWALSQHVPFLLLNGYILGGRGESASKFVESCRAFDINPDDLTDQGCEAAAHVLIESENFKRLYKKLSDRLEVEKRIWDQARVGTSKGP